MPVTTQNRNNRLSGLNTLAYMGVESYTPPSIFQMDRDPTAHDYQGFRIGDMWLSGSGLGIDIWMLAGLDNPSPVGKAWWTQVGIGGAGLTFHTNSGDAIPNGGIVNVLGGNNIFTDAVIGAPNTINITLNDNIVIAGTVKFSSFGVGVLQVDAAHFLFSDNGTNGQVLIGGGAAPAWSTLTAGAGIAITNAANSITITNTGGGGAGFGGLVGDDLNVAVPDGLTQINVVGDGTFITTDAAVANTLGISLTGGLDYEVISGVTATGIPVWKELTSTGASVTITDTGTTINFEAAGVASLTGLTGDSGPGATPDAFHNIYLAGANVIETAAGVTGASQVDIGLVDPGIDGQVIISSAAGAPIWANLTAGSNVAIVNGPNSITISSTGGGAGGAGTFPTNSGTAIQYLGVLNVYGGTNVTTTAQTVVNPNDTVGIDLNSVIYWPNTNAGGTTGVIYLGASKYLHNYGTRNTWYGTNAGNFTLVGAIDNVGLGSTALTAITSGSNNTALGSKALASATNSTNNTAVGFEALYAAYTNGAAKPEYNTAIGSGSMRNAGYTTDNNTAVGYYSFNSGIGVGNSTLGWSTLSKNNGGDYNVAVGYSALGNTGTVNICTGNDNVALGKLALNENTSGYGNVAAGKGALENNTTGYRSVAIGESAASGTTTGNTNICIGYNAGSSLSTGGSGNIYIGNVGGAESSVIRIGTSQTNAYMSGIYSASIGATNAPVYIDSTGKLGSGTSTNCAFLAKQIATVNNVTGDGSTEYFLGTSSILSETYDAGSNFYPGSGAGARAKFTAPINGLYGFKMTITISGIPASGTPAVVVVDPLYFKVFNASNVLQTTYQLVIAPIRASSTGIESFFYSADIYVAATNYVTFSFILLSPSATNDLDIYGEAGTAIYSTYVSGSLISPG